MFEKEAPQFDPSKAQVKGKIFILERDKSGDGRINIDDLEWKYMEGDGDFRSKEVTELRNEADFIINDAAKHQLDKLGVPKQLRSAKMSLRRFNLSFQRKTSATTITARKASGCMS